MTLVPLPAVLCGSLLSTRGMTTLVIRISPRLWYRTFRAAGLALALVTHYPGGVRVWVPG